MGLFNWIEKTAPKISRFFAEVKRAGRPKIGEVGTSGTDICGSFISEEYLSELSDLYTRCEVFDKMRKSEPVIHTSLMTYENPIISATWSIETDDVDFEGNPVDEAMAETVRRRVHANLFENPTRPWAKLLRNILSYLQYGFSVFEKVWEIRNGEVWLADLAPRAQKTIRWNFETGSTKLLSISQQTTTKYIKEIPAIDSTGRSKLVIFTNDQLGDNLEGVGICRYQYRPWKMKTLMSKLLMIGFERFLVKTPTLRANETVSADEKSYAEDFLKRIRSGAQTGGILPSGWEEITGTDNFAGAMVAMKFVEMLNQEMSMAALTQLLLLGMNGKGSYALSEDHSDILFIAMKGVINNIADEFNYHVIPDIIDYNSTGGVPIYPRLTAQISEKSYQAWIENMVKLQGVGTFPISNKLRDIIAERMDMPQIDWEENIDNNVDNNAASPEGGLPPEDQGGGNNPPKKMKSETLCSCGESSGSFSAFWRDLTPEELRAGGATYFAEKKSFFDQMTAEMARKITPVLNDIATGVLKSSSPTEYAPTAAQKKNLSGLIRSYLYAVSLDGLESVGKENNLTVPEQIKKALGVWADRKAQIITDGQISAIRSMVSGAMVDSDLVDSAMSDGAKNKLMSEIVRRAMGKIQRAMDLDINLD